MEKFIRLTNLLDYWKVEFADDGLFEVIKNLLTAKHCEIKIADNFMVVRGNKPMREIINYCLRNSIGFEVNF